MGSAESPAALYAAILASLKDCRMDECGRFSEPATIITVPHRHLSEAKALLRHTFQAAQMCAVSASRTIFTGTLMQLKTAITLFQNGIVNYGFDYKFLDPEFNRFFHAPQAM